MSERYLLDFKITNVKLQGLDTLYSTHSGGPLQHEDDVEVIEKLGFYSLVVMFFFLLNKLELNINAN